MRKFRNAALAAATATAVAFGGTAVASAEQTGEITGGSSTFTSGSSQPDDASLGDILGAYFTGGSSAVGDITGGDQAIDLDNLLGREVADGENAQWGRLWRDALNWTALAAGLGIAIGAGNWALHEGYLPQIPFNFNVQLPF
ncbi:hypothetical protein [Corynebacterium appendicis]|uniref:hypothetical protein n=1 Tax=Corynebacterium appendicis TaxID=163202 RepID=UPI0023526214|nr:hypothetical protein [Corynebacterium appendicis]